MRIEEGTRNDKGYLVEFSLEYYGIVKLIEIIGEAVYMLSPDFKDTHTSTPWKQIERMRHVLVLGYYTVGIDFIKEVVENDLQVLKTQIDEYLSSIP